MNGPLWAREEEKREEKKEVGEGSGRKERWGTARRAVLTATAGKHV